MMFNQPILKRRLTEASTLSGRGNQNKKYSARQYKAKIQQLHGPGYSLIVPPFLCFKTWNRNKNLIYNPLDFEWCEYPQSLIDLMNSKPRGEMIVRDTGTFEQFFWYFNGTDVLIWRQLGKKEQRRYTLPDRCQIIALGSLEHTSLHFKNNKTIILAAGMQNFIRFFGIDKENWQFIDFELIFRVESSSYIQKIVFAGNNHLLIASNTGKHLLLDFTEEIKVYKPQGSLISKFLPSLALLFSGKQIFCEELLMAGDYVISLIRQEQKRSWIEFKTKKLIDNLLQEHSNQEWIIEQTKIEIYRIARDNFQLCLVHTITEENICDIYHPKSTLKEGQKHDVHFYRIVGISFQKQQPLVLQIITRSGLFTTVDLQNSFSIAKGRLGVPTQNAIRQFGLYKVKNTLLKQPFAGNSYCLSSQGLNSLTLTRNSIWYISQKNIELVRNNGLNGTLHKIRARSFADEQWAIFTFKGYFKIKRVKPSDIIICLIMVRDRKLQKTDSNIKRWQYQTHFQQFLQKIRKSVGEDVVIQSLMESLMSKKSEIKLNQEIVNYINMYLEGLKRQHNRDCYYELSSLYRESNTQNQEIIQITNRIKQSLWSLIFTLQTKIITILTQSKKELYVNAYWQALKNAFYKRVRQLFNINPNNIKLHKPKVQKVVNSLERMIHFFKVKDYKTNSFQRQIFFKHQQPEEQDIFENMRLKRLSELNRQKKLQEEAYQTQIEQAVETLTQIQSTLSLEKEITQATSIIKALIEIFLSLSQSNDHEKLSNIKQIIRSKESQRILKLKIIQAATDQDNLRLLHKKIPQLGLEKDLDLLDWLAAVKNSKRLDLIDLKKLAGFLSSSYFERTLKIFEKRVDLQIQLLMRFKDQCFKEIDFNLKALQQSKRKETQTNIRKNLYDEDIKDMLEETIKFYTNENLKALDLIHELIKLGIKDYLNMKSQQNYQQREKSLNNIILIINTHQDTAISNFLVSQLIKSRVKEKVRMVRVKTQKAPVDIQQLLSKRQPRYKKTPPKTPQHLLSCYESLANTTHQ